MEPISGRKAADLLAWAGLGERQARAVLAAGLAGDPVRAGGQLLYDAERIRALTEASVVSSDALAAACPDGLFVSRGRDLDGVTWGFSPWTAVWVRHRVVTAGCLAAVNTVGSFVVSCAEIVDVRRGPTGYHLTTRAARGAWSWTFAGARLITGPGRPWVLVETGPSGADAA
jgi:hypothetical protein